jgi:hypothetical protein
MTSVSLVDQVLDRLAADGVEERVSDRVCSALDGDDDGAARSRSRKARAEPDSDATTRAGEPAVACAGSGPGAGGKGGIVVTTRPLGTGFRPILDTTALPCL